MNTFITAGQKKKKKKKCAHFRQVCISKQQADGQTAIAQYAHFKQIHVALNKQKRTEKQLHYKQTKNTFELFLRTL